MSASASPFTEAQKWTIIKTQFLLMMKTKLFILLLLSVFLNVNSQNQYPDFPRDQHFYLGGDKDFYKDFHKILIEKNLKPCEDKNAYSVVSILIKSENSVDILDSNYPKLQENKCASDLTKEVVKYMDKWIPAKIDGKETPAVERVDIFPDDLFENYKDGYNFADLAINSDFDRTTFCEMVKKRMYRSEFIINRGKEPIKVKTAFIINEQGKLVDIKIIKSSGLEQFDDMILYAIKKASKKRKWQPATIHDIPISTFYKYTFSF